MKYPKKYWDLEEKNMFFVFLQKLGIKSAKAGRYIWIPNV